MLARALDQRKRLVGCREDREAGDETEGRLDEGERDDDRQGEGSR
jgi:hypothetical protein